jgi:nicotinamide-nucleotide amidase
MRVRNLARISLWSLVLLGGGKASAMENQQPPAAESAPVVDYAIIVTGNELLTGVYADGHTLYLTKTLRRLGLHCVASLLVDDRNQDMKEALQFVLPRAQLVIVTGGLGPTETDITREVLSEFTGIALREHEGLLREMEQRFGTPRDQLRANLRRQIHVPVQGTYLANDGGTAVGLVFERDHQVIVALPGPPRELQPMVLNRLIPYLAEKFGTHTLGSSLTVRFVGLGQSQIDETMKTHVHLPEQLMQTSQFEGGRVDFTFSLPGDTEADRQRLEQLRLELQQHMGDYIYADDASTTLEEAVTRKLHARLETLCVVELGTGGSLAAALAQSPHGPKVLAGAFVAPDPEHVAALLQIPENLSDPTLPALELMAEAARQRTAGSWAMVVGPADLTGADGRSRAKVLIRTPREKWLQHTIVWNRNAPSDYQRVTTELLDMLRRVIAGGS